MSTHKPDQPAVDLDHPETDGLRTLDEVLPAAAEAVQAMGQIIYTRREALEITVKALADRAEISERTLRRIERGQLEPDGNGAGSMFTVFALLAIVGGPPLPKVNPHKRRYEHRIESQRTGAKPASAKKGA